LPDCASSNGQNASEKQARDCIISLYLPLDGSFYSSPDGKYGVPDLDTFPIRTKVANSSYLFETRSAELRAEGHRYGVCRRRDDATRATPWFNGPKSPFLSFSASVLAKYFRTAETNHFFLTYFTRCDVGGRRERFRHRQMTDGQR
jgi:hypothetical protein